MPVLIGLLLSLSLSIGPSLVAQGFAVVELFTSEGCSSCPPADQVLQDMVVDAEAEGLPVLGLSFHVDYWNYLGWKDPFSDAAYSERQRRYARGLGEGVYTPQMVVNGQRGFVGSRRGEALLAVKKALATAPLTHISLEVIPGLTDSLRQRYQYRIKGLQPGQQLAIALVEQDLSRAISRGENRGRTLHHTQVVRHFEIQSPLPDGSGKFSLVLPPGVDPAATRIVCFVQTPTLGHITGAIQLPWQP